MKNYREIGRDRRRLAFLLAFPVTFVVVFGMATFDTGQLTSSHPVAVINNDEGAWILNNTTLEFHNFGNEFLSLLENATYENSTIHVFDVHQLTRAEADRATAKREIAAIATIPANFSAGVRAHINQTIFATVSTAILKAFSSGNASSSTLANLSNYTLPTLEPNSTATVLVEGDFSYSEFATAQAYLQGFVDGFVQGLSRIATERVLEVLPPELRTEVDLGPHIDARTRSVPGTEEFRVFDWMAPGLFIFATMLASMGVAAAIAREVEGGQLERLKLSKMGTADFLLGVLIPWSSLGALQVLLLFGTAILMGFRWQGGTEAVGVAVLVGTLSATAAVALGLLLSTVVKSERQAGSIAPLVVVPLSFLTEAFFPISLTIFVEGSPWGLAVRAMRGMLTFGIPISEVWSILGWMAVQTVVLFTVAVFVFRRTRLAAE